MFDRTEILVKAGDGGDGVVSFRHEKYVPFGGPDGGDGGNGGNVVVMSFPEISNLVKFRYKSLHRAVKGGNGRGKKMHGKEGADLVLRVPAGTIVWEIMPDDTKTLVKDLATAGEEVVVALGGRGGWGNTHFVSSVNQVPRLARKGEAGEERRIMLEMRLIADVGIIGRPNAGKSSLLAAASAAKPKIANYAFTTLEPVLGVVTVGQDTFVMAEIPGLIEGAHLGRGLGYEFLRHAMRTKIFIHMIDGTSGSPVEDIQQTNNEMGQFDPLLAQKPQIVAINKCDLTEVKSALAGIKQEFHSAGISVSFVSAATGEGVGELMAQAKKLLDREAEKPIAAEVLPQKVFRPKPRKGPPVVSKQDGTFIIESPELENTVAGFEAADAAVIQYLRGRFDRAGATKALTKAGIRPGDIVRCGHLQWEW
ncbi:MAG: GTPase ObgE [Dehalococcoidales bacterium]|nr:GTPase ObgE [Dehalococcoidales bacterium]